MPVSSPVLPLSRQDIVIVVVRSPLPSPRSDNGRAPRALPETSPGTVRTLVSERKSGKVSGKERDECMVQYRETFHWKSGTQLVKAEDVISLSEPPNIYYL